MKIIDVKIEELERIRRRRSRSAETVELIEAIDSLGAGQARGIAITPQQTEKKIKARLNYAARIAGKRLDIGSDGQKVIFALSNRPARRRRRRSSK